MEDERQCRAKGKEKELAHGVGGLGGGDGSARVAGHSGLHSGITNRATSPTMVTRSGEHLILLIHGWYSY
jgi:hypothetical protein